MLDGINSLRSLGMNIGDLVASAFRAETEELEALTQVLSTETDFSLLVCCTSTRSHRLRLEEMLIARVAALSRDRQLLRLAVGEPLENLLDFLAKAAAKEKPAAILLSGLEGCCENPLSDRGRQVLTELNAARARLPKDVRCPLLLWLPDPVFRALLRHSANLIQDSARVYLFQEPSAEVDRLLAQLKSAPANRPIITALSQKLLALTGRPAVLEDIPQSALLSLEVEFFKNGKQTRGLPGLQDHEPIPSDYQEGSREYYSLAAAAARAANYRLALAAYEKAGRRAADAEDEQQQILANLGLAEVEALVGQLPQAMDAARFALMLAKGFSEKPLIEKAAGLLQSLCQKKCSQLLHRARARNNAASGSAKKDSASQPARESVRELLSAYLVTESDFDMFCLENFVCFAAEHSMALDRSVRTDLLLQTAEPRQVLWAVAKTTTGRLVIDRVGLRKFR